MVGSPIQESPVLKLHALTRGSFAACRALLQRSSLAILQTAWHVGPFSGVCLTFVVNLCGILLVHGFIVSFECSFYPSLLIRKWVGVAFCGLS